MSRPITPEEVRHCAGAIIPGLPEDPSLNLVELQILDSYSVIELVDHLEQAFAIQFGPTDLTFDNLMSLAAMTATVNRLRGASQ